MGENFEEIVSDLEDIQFKEMEAPIAYNATISGGIMLPHGEGCICESSVLILGLKIEGADSPLELAVFPNSPLGAAILSGEFAARFAERLADIS